MRQRRCQDQHVAALLHRHLVVLGSLPAAVDLAVRLRIRPQVVRGEREPPPLEFRVLEDGLKLRAQHARVEKQEKR